MNPIKIVGVGSIFIDDIVYPDGSTKMAVLGGGVLHALMGAKAWQEPIGIIGCIGYDAPPSAFEFLEKNFDTQGITPLQQKQARVWQLFEEDGRRTEVPRIENIQAFVRGPLPGAMVAAYQDVQAWYLLKNFDDMNAWMDITTGLRLWEPLQQIMLAQNRDKMAAVLRNNSIDIISPNLLESQQIYGLTTPRELISAYWQDGAQILALRMGEQGSIIAVKATQKIWHIPACDNITVIDPTGAGNTYCGAFLANLLDHTPAANSSTFTDETLLTAACNATATAALCVTQPGILSVDNIDPNYLYQLSHSLKNRIQQLS
ncbi:PfkB family carbohydrate kinase [Anaerolineales bacterium]